MGKFHRRGNAAVHKRHRIEESRRGNITLDVRIAKRIPKGGFFAKMCKWFRDAYRDAKLCKRMNRMAFESVERREERRQKKKRKIEKLQKEMREI